MPKEVLGWKSRPSVDEKNNLKTARVNASECTPSTPVESGLSPYSGPFGKDELMYLLKKSLFGVTVEDVQHFSGKTLTQVLSELLVVEDTLNSQPLNEYTDSGTDAAGVAVGAPWGEAVLPMESGQSPYDNATRALSAVYWNMGIALNMNRTAHEKLCVFWFNHFPIGSEAVNRGQRSYVYVKTLRENANTPLHEMCKNITKDPAMLAYLNGEVNAAGSPDENYARELQELFTIGKELPLDKRYTEHDVREAARTLTGHRMSASGGFNVWAADYGFHSWEHDTGDKQFSAFYNNTIIPGGTNGEAELNALISMIFDDSQPVALLNGTAWEGMTRADIIADHLVKKMYRFFVSPHITEHVKEHIIPPLAAIYKQNNFTILPVLEVLFSSEHFFDEGLRGASVKMPMDVTIGLKRLFDLDLEFSDVKARYGAYREFFSRADGMGQGYLAPPNIAGWQAFYQTPQYHLLWINSDSLPKRQDFSRSLIGNGIFTFGGGSFNLIAADVFAFAQKLDNPANPNSLILELNAYLLGITLSVEHRNKLKTDHLLTGQAQDYYWTDAWNNATAPGASAFQIQTVESRLKSLLDYLVRLEEFQLY